MKEQIFDKKHRMGKWKFVFIPFGIAAFLALFSFIVMQLWNNLMPEIFHLTPITFWQAMGLLILSKILFGFSKPGGGRFGGGGAPWMMRRKMQEKLKHMSPEQKEKFKQHMRDRMCDFRGRRGWEDFDWDGDKPEEKGTSEKTE